MFFAELSMPVTCGSPVDVALSGKRTSNGSNSRRPARALLIRRVQAVFRSPDELPCASTCRIRRPGSASQTAAFGQELSLAHGHGLRSCRREHAGSRGTQLVLEGCRRLTRALLGMWP